MIIGKVPSQWKASNLVGLPIDKKVEKSNI